MNNKQKDWWPVAFVVVGCVWTAFELVRENWGWAVLGSALVAFAVVELRSEKSV